MAGLTRDGFERKNFSTIYSNLEDRAKVIFQDLVRPGEEIDTSSTSTIGRMIGLITPGFDELWQASLQLYQAFDPDSAYGVALDNIVQFMGVQRRLGASTTFRGSVWGLVGTSIPEGATVSSDLGDQFVSSAPMLFNTNDMMGFSVRATSIVTGQVCKFTVNTSSSSYVISHVAVDGDTVESVTDSWMAQVDTSGILAEGVNVEKEDSSLKFENVSFYSSLSFIDAENAGVVSSKKRLMFSSVEDGDIPAPVNTVRNIVTPIYGWLSVNNEIPATPGSEHEDDNVLRKRFEESKAIRAMGMSDSLYSQLRDLENVEYVRIYQNITDATDVRGLPPHSYLAVVQGGADSEIGKVIWDNKPLGIASTGNTSVDVQDSNGNIQTVYFGRGQNINIFAKVRITQINDYMPSDAADKIKEAITTYINSLAVGNDVIYTRLFTPINSIEGFQVDLLEIGTDPNNLQVGNIAIPWDGYPATTLANIDVAES